jgi:hypothetical protein
MQEGAASVHEQTSLGVPDRGASMHAWCQAHRKQESTPRSAFEASGAWSIDDSRAEYATGST